MPAVTPATEKEWLQLRIAQLASQIDGHKRATHASTIEASAQEHGHNRAARASSVEASAQEHVMITVMVENFDKECTQCLLAAEEATAAALSHTTAWLQRLFGDTAARSLKQAGSMAYGCAVPWSDIDCSINLPSEPVDIEKLLLAHPPYPTKIQCIPPSLLRFSPAAEDTTNRNRNTAKRARNPDASDKQLVAGRIPANCHVDVWLESRDDSTGEQWRRGKAMQIMTSAYPRLSPLVRALKGAFRQFSEKANKEMIQAKQTLADETAIKIQAAKPQVCPAVCRPVPESLTLPLPAGQTIHKASEKGAGEDSKGNS